MQGTDSQAADIAIVGAGAAGLATAIFAARLAPGRSILLLDGARRIGAKILVSGGGRCNVTNVKVTPADYFGGNPNIIRRVLREFTVEQTVAFFQELGVPLHVEEYGKYFPDSNQARTVLEALLAEAGRLGVQIRAGCRVARIDRRADHFELVVASTDPGAALNVPATHVLRAGRLVLATGGLSLPKTGSDGAGYEFARHLGHSIIPTTPALVPLILAGNFHGPLSGVSHDVALTVRAAGAKPVTIRGPLLWTHFGISGPAPMDASRVWHRARLERKEVEMTANFLPDRESSVVEQWLVGLAGSRPKATLQAVLGEVLPARVAQAVLGALNMNGQTPMAHLSRDLRRRLLHGLSAWSLPVRDSRGYLHAEVTAGGVPLTEIDPAGMHSRVCPGLHLVGEILDVDGRIGGFNFQWAWSSARVAARGITG